MICVRCRTNLDKYSRIQWPTRLAVLPRLGEQVASLDKTVSLRVVALTHYGTSEPADHREVYVEIELHAYT